MPKNKFQDVRYRVLDECLRDQQRYYTIEELAKKCDTAIFAIDDQVRPPISTRQIRHDLNFLQDGYKTEIQSLKIPGEKKHYFRYADPEFSISNKPLTEEDLINLKSSLYILRRFSGLHNEASWIEEFAARIEKLPSQLEGHQKETLPENQKQIIAFDNQDENESGANWIIQLYKAIEKEHPLTVTYKEFGSGNEVKYNISPYLLKQFNRRWFLLCASEGLDHLTTLPLDRLLDIEPGTHKYIAYPGDEPLEFFEDIIGVINNMKHEVLEIELEVHKKLLPYLESKLLHESQKKAKATEDPEWYSLKINVKPNYEFYALILSHGERIRIVSPESVRNEMKQKVNMLHAHYNE